MSGSVNTTHGHIDHVFPNWISVDFKLPEKSGEYLCCDEKNNMNVIIYSAKHKSFYVADSADKHGVEFCKFYYNRITHWMPLPPFPEEV